ncbi:hypothetical protein K440DRAFT_375705 [Wilcoxina mikolae CBS 423.85]|nr:hypothetical protein K440DRAFT_375705 [Wilcoxina mikolae CBS 423.85]
MKSIAILLSLTLCCLEWTTCLGAVIYDTNDTLVAPGSVLDARYSLTRDFCWLLAHTSIRVGDTIIIDGGMAKYKIQKDGKDKRVLDFNFETLSLDLTQDFDVNDLGNTLNVLTERPANNPPTNRGGMWTDGVNVWVQGGHFYAKTPYYNTSRWFVKTEDIPPYGIWKFSKQNGWEQEKGYKVQDGSVVERTVSGAAACTNETCYWVGGYVNSRTSPPSSGTSPLTKWSAGRRGMLVFDLATKSLKNESMADYTSTDPEYGFHFGTLQHFLSSDKQKGLLLSLMAEKSLIYPANDSSSSDDPYDPLGTPLNDAVMLYDIEMDKWHKQPAVSYTGNDPPTRSRFCGVLAHDVESKNWDLWLFGGQRINDTSTGVDDIYVLTMPAFMSVPDA